MMSAVRWLASAVLLLSVAGCASWHPKTGPTATVLATPHERTRFTLDDGSRVEVLWPQVRDDTLRGVSPTNGVTVAIPLFAVQRVEVHETDVVGTALWGFSIVAVALAVATLLVVLLGKPYEF